MSVSRNSGRSRTAGRPPVWIAAAACALAVCASRPSQASPVVFADFFATTGSPFTFAFQNANSATLTGTTTVNFEFRNIANFSQNNVPQAAILTVNLNASPNATAGAGGNLDQPITGGTFSFRRVSDNANLLSGSISGDITGKLNSSNATLDGSQATGNTVALSSSILNFNSVINASYQFLFPTVTPGLALSTTGASSSRNFTTDAQGSFTGDPGPTVPEPASVALMGAGLTLTGLAALRKKARRVAD